MSVIDRSVTVFDANHTSFPSCRTRSYGMLRTVSTALIKSNALFIFYDVADGTIVETGCQGCVFRGVISLYDRIGLYVELCGWV